MKFSTIISLRNFFHFIEFFHKKGSAERSAAEEPPLRSELFGSDQMRQYGQDRFAGILESYKEIPVPKNNPQTSAKIELGKKLFFDRRLSGTDGKM